MTYIIVYLLYNPIIFLIKICEHFNHYEWCRYWLQNKHTIFWIHIIWQARFCLNLNLRPYKEWIIPDNRLIITRLFKGQSVDAGKVYWYNVWVNYGSSVIFCLLPSFHIQYNWPPLTLSGSIQTLQCFQTS